MTDAERKAIEKYHQKFDDIKIRVPKGDRERYKAYAESKGLSLNTLLIQLIKQDMGEALGEDTEEPHNNED